MPSTPDLATITAEDVALLTADDLTTLAQKIGGRLLEIAREAAEIEPGFRALKSEAAYLEAALSAVQSALRMYRAVLR